MIRIFYTKQSIITSTIRLNFLQLQFNMAHIIWGDLNNEISYFKLLFWSKMAIYNLKFKI